MSTETTLWIKDCEKCKRC